MNEQKYRQTDYQTDGLTDKLTERHVQIADKVKVKLIFRHFTFAVTECPG